MIVRAFLSMGSNLGDRRAILREAISSLSGVVAVSPVYETDPVGGPPQPEYLNVVVEVDSALEPLDLLRACLVVEAAMGRIRTERWGPRPIDVDVLIYDDRTIDEPDLVVPHPRMHERGFVLVPLGELDADPMLPGGRRLASLRLAPGVVLDVRAFAPPLRVPR